MTLPVTALPLSEEPDAPLPTLEEMLATERRMLSEEISALTGKVWSVTAAMAKDSDCYRIAGNPKLFTEDMYVCSLSFARHAIGTLREQSRGRAASLLPGGG